jgi:hypothetical protein
MKLNPYLSYQTYLLRKSCPSWNATVASGMVYYYYSSNTVTTARIYSNNFRQARGQTFLAKNNSNYSEGILFDTT